MGWTQFIKSAGKGATRLLEGTGKGVGTAAKGIGEGMGATAKGLGGWKGVVGTGAVVSAANSDHGLTGVASDVMFGQGGSEKVQEHGVAGEALNLAIGEKGKQAVSEATDAVSQQVSSISQSYSQSAPAYSEMQQAPIQQDGFGSFMSQATTSPFDMGGNFLNNLMSGNVSTMSMAAMIASSFLVFGRFGLLTKALGALLGIHTIGRNSQPVYAQHPQPAYAPRQVSPVAAVPPLETEVVERNRGIGR